MLRYRKLGHRSVPPVAVVAFRQGLVSPLASGARYLLVVFPCFIAAAAVVVPHRRLRVALIVAGTAGNLACFVFWTRWGWVG